MDHDVEDNELSEPEPDYDQDEDSADNGGIIGVAAAATCSTVTCSETCSANVDFVPPSTLSAAAAAITSSEEDGFDGCNFEQVRAKLDAFSRAEQTLVATLSCDSDVPEPDYSDEDLDSNPSSKSRKSDNAVLYQSKEQKDLLRELLRNQKLGVSVLSKKTELDKEMERRKMRQRQREEDELQKQKRSTFDLRMEQQAKKLIMAEQQHPDRKETQGLQKSGDQQPEFLRVHSKLSKLKSSS